MTPDSNNPRLINWPTGLEIEEMIEKESFQVPYNGTKDFYNKDFIKGFENAIEWLSTRLEPEASQPAKSIVDLISDRFNGGSGDMISLYDAAKFTTEQLAAIRKELSEVKDDRSKVKASLDNLCSIEMQTAKQRDTLKAEMAEVEEKRKANSELLSNLNTRLMNDIIDLQQQNQSYREALKDALVTLKTFLPDAWATIAYIEAVLSSGEKKTP